MGTEVLSPRALFSERFGGSPAVCPRRKACNYGNLYSYPNQQRSNNPNFCIRPKKHNQNHYHQKKRSVTGSSEPSVWRRSSCDELRMARNGPSETLIATVKTRSSSDDLRFARPVEKITILRRGVSLDSMIKSDDVRSIAGNSDDVYAGSAFAVSPEPSSLPLPSFSKKKESLIDDLATRDLRRLLRLD